MITKEIAFAFCRHLLTAVGSVGVAKGVVDATSVDAIIGGAMAIVGMVWSVRDKQSSR